jgi:hypothetical protein
MMPEVAALILVSNEPTPRPSAHIPTPRPSSHIEIVLAICDCPAISLAWVESIRILLIRFASLLVDELAQIYKEKEIYWQRRGGVKWIPEVDSTTGYFHSTANSGRRT